MGPKKGLFNEQNLEMLDDVSISQDVFINLTFIFWCEIVGGDRRG